MLWRRLAQWAEWAMLAWFAMVTVAIVGILFGLWLAFGR